MFDPTPVGRLKPAFTWLEPILGGKKPGAGVVVCVSIFAISITILNIDCQYVLKYYDFGDTPKWSFVLPKVIFAVISSASKYLVFLPIL